MGNPALAPQERFTYRHYRTWPEAERWELIDGLAFSMSPAPGTWHQDLLGRLFAPLWLHLKGKPCKVYTAPFDILFPRFDEEDDEVDTLLQPDILVYCDRSRLSPRGGRGAPDFVVEILSRRTTSRDFGAKRQVYERHGVREYWIVDGKDKVIHAWRQAESGGFGEEEILEEGESAVSAVIEGFSVDLRELFAEDGA